MITRLTLLLLALVLGAAPAHAQFADQATFATAVGGSANAQTITVANASTMADVQGVLVKYVPSASNTAAANVSINSLPTCSYRKPSTAGLVALSGGEIQSGQALVFMYDGTFCVIVSAVNDSLSIGSANLLNSSLGFDTPVNLQINATVATNALTISLVGNNGSAASVTNPVLVPFRDSTIGNGGPVVVSLQGALSFTVASTNTMGCSNATVCRLWVVAINNGGTLALCAINASSATQVFALNEGIMWTSQAGTGGGSTSGLLYCGVSGVTSKAIRILGYMELTETVAGTWATLPTYIQLMGPGIKKPGDVVQVAYATSSTYANTGNTYSPSSTPPAPAGGASVTSVSFSTQSAANRMRIRAGGVVGNSGSGASNVFLFVHNGTTTLAVGSGYGGAASVTQQISLLYEVLGTASGAITYTLYYTGSVANTFINGSAGTQFGGANTSIEVQEIMGALPDNDNGDLRMVG